MKKLRVFALVAVVAMLVASFASAQGINNLPGGGWWSGQQVQNVGDAESNIQIMAYGKDGGEPISASETVAPGGAFTFSPFAGLEGMPDGFQGSAVVSADQPIKAIVNVTNMPAGNVGVTGGTAAAQYQGIDGAAVADVLYFPLAKGDFWGATTTFYIQNAGTEAATFTAVFAMNDGNEYTYTTPSVQPNRMAIFSVFNAAGYDKGDALGGDVRLGALTVTSEQDMAGVVMEHATANETAVALFSTRGFTENDFDTVAYAPVIKNTFFGQFTGLQVQNVCENPIDITVTYQVAQGPNVGQTKTETATGVAPGTSHTFVHLEATGSELAAGDLAGATIVATGNFVAIVNEQTPDGSVGITYSAMPDRSATPRISAPLFKDAYWAANSGLQVQNVGDAATQATAAFACTSQAGVALGEFASNPFSIDAGGTFLFFQPSVAANPGGNLFTNFPTNANCSVTIVAEDQNIVAIVNEAAPGLDNNNYEGFNLPID